MSPPSSGPFIRCVTEEEISSIKINSSVPKLAAKPKNSEFLHINTKIHVTLRHEPIFMTALKLHELALKLQGGALSLSSRPAAV